MTNSTPFRVQSVRRLVRVLCAGASGSLLCALATAPLQAQRMITAPIGVGAALTRPDYRIDRSHPHVMAGVEVSPPLFPLGARADATLLFGGAERTLALTGSAVLSLKLPVVRPYLLGGYGYYSAKGEERKGGVSAGFGVRVTAGPLRIFGEARRHWAIQQDMVTLGIAM